MLRAETAAEQQDRLTYTGKHVPPVTEYVTLQTLATDTAESMEQMRKSVTNFAHFGQRILGEADGWHVLLGFGVVMARIGHEAWWCAHADEATKRAERVQHEPSQSDLAEHVQMLCG